MTRWQIEWWNEDKKRWEESHGYLTIDTEEKARKYLQEDINYFYQRIKIRLIRWEGTIIEETTGSQ